MTRWPRPWKAVAFIHVAPDKSPWCEFTALDVVVASLGEHNMQTYEFAFWTFVGRVRNGRA